MTRRASSAAVAILFCSLTLPVWGQQYYLYEPKLVTAEEKGKAKDGILVTEVPVQKGDTLYDISRKFSGNGMYYPQILLFNKIKNPKRIYPGDTLKVPVTADSATTESAPVKESKGISKKLKVKKKVTNKGVIKDKNQRPPVARKTGVEKTPAGDAAVAATGQKLFERAVKAYKQDDFGAALVLFDRYIADNSSSPLAADASLYKAECYMKLSSQ